MLRVLMVGDTVGETAVAYVAQQLPLLRQKHQAHVCVVNAENAHQGKGLNDDLAHQLLNAGADVLTGGDHSFDKHLVFPLMNRERRILRPANYPTGVPGQGYCLVPVPTLEVTLAVLNLRGNAFFQNPIRDPFTLADDLVRDINAETPLVVVDFHAEATAEKVAMGHYLDGKVSAVVGTHTHVPTADEQILPKGTGYLTDMGFSGPVHSVIGMDIATALNRYTKQIPQKYVLGTGPQALHGVLLELDTHSGSCRSITRIRVSEVP